MAGSELVRLRMLGTFQVQVGARLTADAAWRRKVRHLVALLALAHGHSLHRDEIMDQLWPESDPDAAGNNLHRTLHEARRLLEPHLAPGVPPAFLSLHDDLLALAPSERIWTDVDAFLAAAALARRAHRPEAYAAALALYHGELLPADRYEDWTVRRREELEQLTVDLLGELAALYEARGDDTKAQDAFEQLLARDRAHEEAHAGLMRLYTRRGRREAALRQFALLRDALDQEFGVAPAPSSRRLYEQIAGGAFPPPDTAMPSDGGAGTRPEPMRWPATLPAPETGFVGREREISDLIGALASARLITLGGSGGSGKTRLALQAAALIHTAYRDGVIWAGLAPLADGRMVAQSVAGAAGVQETPGEPIAESLVAALAGRQTLLLLDNCEHVVRECAELAGYVLRGCPHVQIMATSRNPLELPEEVVWPVPALALPADEAGATPDDLLAYDAIQFYLERARAVRPALALTVETAPPILRICRRLEGIPLALELAAARVNVLTVQEIAARLEHVLTLLPEHQQAQAPRHRTLRAAFEWSHELLSEHERVLFRRLAAFAGGWSADAAEEVCAGAGVERAAVLDVLARLAQHSLVVAEERDGAMRFRMLETIRQYAAEKLEAAQEDAAQRERHLSWCLALVEQIGPTVVGPQEEEWTRRIEMEHDNVRAALRFALERGAWETGLHFGAQLWQFWWRHGLLTEGREWLNRILDHSADLPTAALPMLARALNAAGTVEHLFGANRQAIARFQEALAIQRARDDRRAVAAILGNLASPLYYDGDAAQAMAHYEESLQISRALELPDIIAVALNGLGTITKDQGELPRAAALFEECASLYRQMGEKRYAAGLLLNVADVAYLQGAYGRAVASGQESLAILRSFDDRPGQIECLDTLGKIARARGELAQAHAYLDEGLALSREMDDRWSTALLLHHLGQLAYTEGDVQGATTVCRESLELQRSLGYKQGCAAALTMLAAVALAQADWEQATTLYDEALALYVETGARLGIVECLEGIVALGAARGQAEAAVRLSAAAEAARRALGAPLAPADRPASDAVLASLRRTLAPGALARAQATGRGDSLDQAVAQAVAIVRPAPAPSVDAADALLSLTARERDIAALVAQGYTNKQIADARGIALRTVDTHVGRILAKLGYASRAELNASDLLPHAEGAPT